PSPAPAMPKRRSSAWLRCKDERRGRRSRGSRDGDAPGLSRGASRSSLQASLLPLPTDAPGLSRGASRLLLAEANRRKNREAPRDKPGPSQYGQRADFVEAHVRLPGTSPGHPTEQLPSEEVFDGSRRP